MATLAASIMECQLPRKYPLSPLHALSCKNTFDVDTLSECRSKYVTLPHTHDVIILLYITDCTCKPGTLLRLMPLHIILSWQPACNVG